MYICIEQRKQLKEKIQIIKVVIYFLNIHLYVTTKTKYNMKINEFKWKRKYENGVNEKIC